MTEELIAIEEVVEAIVAPRESGIIAVVREEIPETFSIEEEEPIVVEELEPFVATVETILPPAPDDPFMTVVTACSDIAIAQGMPAVAAMMPSVLLEATLPSVTPEILASLVEGGLANDDGTLSARFLATRNAWHAIIAGTSEDWDATGGAMLDEFCAGMLARLLGVPARTDALRKDLRARGVAAFGLAA